MSEISQEQLLRDYLGTTLFTSPWITIDQEHLAQFSWSTYLDPEYTDLTASKNNPYGSELVDGFLLVSLLTSIQFNYSPVRVSGIYGLNYGLDRVRFVSPVFVGQRIRFVSVLDKLEPRGEGVLVTTTNTIEIEGQDKPAMVATWLTLQMTVDQP